jgi:heterotetrameric sarcosine oxidase gamma subunit
MTAISALENIHKRGLFGDHQDKNENELISVSEVKHLQIIQIVHYKKSTLQIALLNLDNLKFPEATMLVNSNKDTRILWSGPSNWLLVSTKKDILSSVQKICDDKNFAVTDLSHSRAIIELKGSNSKEVLKKGCPINLNEFKVNNCANSIFHGITITIDMISNDPETFRIFALRSFGESLHHSITDACLEDGYKGI